MLNIIVFNGRHKFLLKVLEMNQKVQSVINKLVTNHCFEQITYHLHGPISRFNDFQCNMSIN